MQLASDKKKAWLPNRRQECSGLWLQGELEDLLPCGLRHVSNKGSVEASPQESAEHLWIELLRYHENAKGLFHTHSEPVNGYDPFNAMQLLASAKGK